MQAMCKALVAIAMLVIFSAPLRAEKAPSNLADQAPVKIGQPAGDFTFKDIRYLPRKLADFGDKKAYVILFTTLDCPVVQRYLPKLKALDEAYRDKGVQFLAMNVGPSDDLREVAYQALTVDAEFPFAKDFDGQVVRAVGASRAAEVVVLDADKKLRYRGHVDNQFRLGGEKPSADREDLKLAIDDVLAGRDVAVSQTAVDGCLISFPKPRTRSTPVTFNEHIVPLLQKHCQGCHHAGAPEAPFALASYQETADHAAMIAEVVSEQRMPPWYGSKQHGEFTNYRGMTADERNLFEDWVRGDCQEGNPAKAPPAREYAKTKWRIGEPDVVIKTSVQKIPATGYIPYRYINLSTHFFKKDTWVQGVQILPENAKAMHHCNMFFMKIGENPSAQNFITGQVPGGDAMILDNNVAFLIPAGSILALQVHYVTLGQETTDQISVGLRYAREVVKKSLKNTQVTNLKFHIPPGAPHYKVSAVRELKHDVTGYGMFSHMHLRGEDMTFRAIYPDGKDETLLVIPNYNFDWQQAYRWAENKQKFPKGTKLEVSAHYDNSPFNPYNPDATKTVEEGQQTFQEMMYGFVFYTEDDENLNLTVDPKNGTVIPGAEASAKK
jgi:thiol-disulfide isomerase/thioredoxin